MISDVFYRLRAFFRREAVDAEMDDELRFHFEHEFEKHMRAGMTREEAIYQTRMEFGGVEQVREECRESRGLNLVETTLQDIRYGLRALRKSPAFALVAIVTLSLGIGISTWSFNILRQWVMQATTFSEADRLMMVWEKNTRKGWIMQASAPDLLDWQEQNHEFENLSGWTTRDFNFTGDERPQRILGARVSPNFFRMLKVSPALGRDFRSEEDHPGLGHVAMISTGMWHDRFNGDAGALGKTFVMDGEQYTLVGVVPENFHLTLMGRVNVWVPLEFTDKERADRSTGWLTVIGRLKPGATEDAAQQSLSAIATRLEKQFPESNTDSGIHVNSLNQEIGKHTGEQGLYTGFVVGICILLISCSNIAGIYLARALSRRKEMTMRLALGARKFRLARQLLAENLMLLPLAVALGLGFAAFGGKWTTAAIPFENRGYLPNYGAVSMDYAGFLYATGISLVSLLLFSMAPMLESRKLNLTDVLKASQGSANLEGRHLRKGLVVLEIIFAMVALVPAGLVTKSLSNIYREDPGFRADDVMAVRTSLPALRYKETGQTLEFYDQVLSHVQALPQVQSAAVSQFIPFGHSSGGAELTLEGRPVPKPSEVPNTQLNATGPEYLSTLGLRLTRGRYIAAEDGRDSLPVIVVNQTLVRRLFPHEDPLGHRVRLGREDNTWRTIVGVVNDIKTDDLAERPRNQSYVPFVQMPSRSAAFVVRSTAAPSTIAAEIRQAVWAVDKGQPVADIVTLQQQISEQEAPFRIFSQSIGFCAGLALFLAGIGIYGVMAFLVESRTREIGIRMACGARARTILWLVLKGNLKLVATGICLGLLASWQLARLLASLLYRVSTNDPATYLVAVLVLAAAILLASLVPLRRAMGVDPMIVLRYE